MELTAPMVISIAVVCIVVVFQAITFSVNLRRINLFSKIFSGQDYDLKKDEHDMVTGITGSGNEIFDDIKSAINGYLVGTQGTEVDFQLLKDSVDRHCDMIEDEINSQMPLPLYFGLAGTMTGAIIGLLALLFGGAIKALMGGAAAVATLGAAENINDLLWGVAIAMIASAIGIILTSINTIYFKNKKLQEETQKNKFLAWMQSRVLSAVPSGVSQQMKALVNQLATFNRNFRSNTEAINTTLREARGVYQSQADVISQYKAIDLEAIANGVSSIMRRLRSSTESLDNFTQYIDTVHEYYEQMQVFAEKLNQESDRLHVLEDIRTFFNSHKGVIAEETTYAHKSIAESISAVKSSTEQQINETYIALTEQSQRLRDAVEQNNTEFNNLCRDMRERFNAQMQELPSVAQNLRQLQDIPAKLENVVNKINQSQERLASQFQQAANRIAASSSNTNNTGSGNSADRMSELEIPASMKWTTIIGIILITLATLGNTAYNIWKSETSMSQSESSSNVTVTTDSLHVDSTSVNQ